MGKILEQIVKFVGLSGVGWLIDFALYNFLLLFFEAVEKINMVSSLVAASFVFWTSVRVTFQNKDGGTPLIGKFAVYVAYQIILILVVSYLLLWVHIKLQTILSGTGFYGFSAFFAKVMVTPVTMVINFCVMKGLIEKI